VANGKYWNAQYEHLAGIGRVRDSLDNPHHRAVLANYQEHVALEQSGRWREIFSRRLIVEHPIYKTANGTEFIYYDGPEAIGAWYEGMLTNVATLMDEKLAVHDWGLASYSDVVEFATGATLKYRGVDIESTDTVYKLSQPQVMFWMYDSDAILLGEHLYTLGTPDVSVADPEDVLTKERMIESCEPFTHRSESAAIAF
jgi:hypothetical protein